MGLGHNIVFTPFHVLGSCYGGQLGLHKAHMAHGHNKMELVMSNFKIGVACLVAIGLIDDIHISIVKPFITSL